MSFVSVIIYVVMQSIWYCNDYTLLTYDHFKINKTI